MKIALLLLILACQAFAGTIALTDTKGRTIQVEILAATDAEVSVRNAKGEVVSIPIARLTDESRENVRDEVERMEMAKPKGIIVTHTITKLVEGKFRYFFDVRNYTESEWTGTARITLLNVQKGVKNADEKFPTPFSVTPKMGFVRFLEAHTGTAAVLNDWYVEGFSYEITDATGKILFSGKGELSQKKEGF